METLKDQKKQLEAQGYKVTLNSHLVAREAQLGEDDDWLFADMPGALMLTMSRDGYFLDVEREGDAEAEFYQVDDAGEILTDGIRHTFRNAFVPDAFRSVLSDGEIAVVDGVRYRCRLYSNGWFTAFMGHRDDEVVCDHGEPTYDIGTLSCWADMLEEYIKERQAAA